MLVALDPAAAQQPVAAAGSTSLKPAKPIRVVNLKNGSFVIDAPGNWVLNRSWRFEGLADVPLNIIDVVANDVVLDFRSFEIEVERFADTAPVTVINVQGDRFTLINATVTICCGEQGSALRSTGRSTTIEGLRGFSLAAIRLEGGFAVVRDSVFHVVRGIAVAGSLATIESSVISCGFFGGCVSLADDGNRLLNNRIVPGGEFSFVRIGGNRNVVAGNLIDWGGDATLETAIDILGDANVVRENTLAAAGGTGVFVKVSGTANVIDGNIGADMGDISGIAIGIRFEQDGNFDGDNRIEAAAPFDLGGTTQTDWGGNVGY
jgi:hypothetical protein